MFSLKQYLNDVVQMLSIFDLILSSSECFCSSSSAISGDINSIELVRRSRLVNSSLKHNFFDIKILAPGQQIIRVVHSIHVR